MRIADFDDHSETLYRLVTKSETLELTFANPPPLAAVGAGSRGARVRDGQRMRVEALDQLRSEETLELDLPARQALKMALIIVDSTYTTTRGRQRLLQAADSPAAFYRDNSYGDWTIEGDAFGPYTIDIPNCNDSELDPIAARASAAAQAAGVDVSQYDNFMFYLPASAGCTWGGIAEVGTNPTQGFRNGKNTWYRSDGGVVFAQELGHNFGLLHSHTCTAPPYASADYGNAACAGFREYGDAYTPMGGGCGHFNAPEAGSLGLISGCNTVAVASTGTFEIGPIETRCGAHVRASPAPSTSIKAPIHLCRVQARQDSAPTPGPRGVYLHTVGGLWRQPHQHDRPGQSLRIGPSFTRHSAQPKWTEPTSGVVQVVAAVRLRPAYVCGRRRRRPGSIDGTRPRDADVRQRRDGGPGARMDGEPAGDGAGTAGSAGNGVRPAKEERQWAMGRKRPGADQVEVVARPVGRADQEVNPEAPASRRRWVMTGGGPPSDWQDSGCRCSTLGAGRRSHGAALPVLRAIPSSPRRSRRFRVSGQPPEKSTTSALIP